MQKTRGRRTHNQTYCRVSTAKVGCYGLFTTWLFPLACLLLCQASSRWNSLLVPREIFPGAMTETRERRGGEDVWLLNGKISERIRATRQLQEAKKALKAVQREGFWGRTRGAAPSSQGPKELGLVGLAGQSLGL